MTTEVIQNEIDVAQAASAIRALLGTEDTVDDVLRQARGADGGFQSKQATMVTIYNRWDGRTQEVAAYQAPKTLAERFPRDNQTYPPEVQNQLAWVLGEPERAGELKRRYGPVTFDQALPCYFSPEQADDLILGDVQAAGIPLHCMKRNRDTGEAIRFTDELARQAHMKKHPRSMEALKTYRDLKAQRDRANAEETNNLTLTKLVEMLLAQQSGAPVQASESRHAASETVVEVPPRIYESEYKCDDCGQSSPTGAGLAAHRRAAHKE